MIEGMFTPEELRGHASRPLDDVLAVVEHIAYSDRNAFVYIARTYEGKDHVRVALRAGCLDHPQDLGRVERHRIERDARAIEALLVAGRAMIERYHRDNPEHTHAPTYGS